MAAAAFLNYDYEVFRLRLWPMAYIFAYINQISNIPNFGDDWSNSKEMATVFGIKNGGDRHLEFLQLCISDDIDKLEINDAIFALNLMMIDQ